MEVTIFQLRAIAEKLFSHFENLGYDSVEITEDYYWNIPEEQKYDVLNDPKDLDVGQLTDDWEFLQSVLEEDRDPINYDLVWLGKILEVIGEKAVR